MRYQDREILENTEDASEDLRKKRGVKKIHHYSTSIFGKPSVEDYANLTLVPHLWKVGDRFYKLAHEHYGSSKYWWVIAQFNSKPTESHVLIGEKIIVPLPLDSALIALERKE